MEILRKFRWVLYPIVFFIVFLMGAYCTFPTHVVREMAESSITYAALGFGPKNRGIPDVTMKDVSLWRISGAKLKDLEIKWDQTDKEEPLMLKFDSAKARLGIWSLLTGGRSIFAKLDLYGGSLDLDLKFRPKNKLRSIYVSGSKVDLSKTAFFQSMIGAPIDGKLNLDLDLESKTQMIKDGKGAIRLDLESLFFGPGSINLPAGGFVSSLSVPKIGLGKLVGDFSLNDGKLSSKTLSLTGGDLEGGMNLEIDFGRSPLTSKINGEGWFKVKREFINENETLKMLYDLIPELKESSKTDGKVAFTVRGSLVRPMPKLERYVGEKNTAKKDRVARKNN